MPYDPSRHHRRSIRLPDYDYTQPGAYFVTICTHNRAHLFNNPDFRRIAEQQLVALTNAGSRGIGGGRLVIDAWVVMPNHIHAIIVITAAPPAPAPPPDRPPAPPAPAPPPDRPPAPTGRAQQASPSTGTGPTPQTPPAAQHPRVHRAPAAPLPTRRPAVSGPDRPASTRRPAPTAPDRSPAPPDRPVAPTDDHATPANDGLGINVDPGSLGAIVRSYKAAVARRINALRNTPGAEVWLRGYWEVIIRDARHMEVTRRYIADNPRRWAERRTSLDAMLRRMHRTG